METEVPLGYQKVRSLTGGVDASNCLLSGILLIIPAYFLSIMQQCCIFRFNLYLCDELRDTLIRRLAKFIEKKIDNRNEKS